MNNLSNGHFLYLKHQYDFLNQAFLEKFQKSSNSSSGYECLKKKIINLTTKIENCSLYNFKRLNKDFAELTDSINKVKLLYKEIKEFNSFLEDFTEVVNSRVIEYTSQLDSELGNGVLSIRDQCYEESSILKTYRQGLDLLLKRYDLLKTEYLKIETFIDDSEFGLSDRSS